MKIEFTAHPKTEDLEKLTNSINYEAAISGVTSKATPYAFFMREEDGEIVAGANGSLIYGTIYIDQLWVSPAYRKQGYGLALMEKVHTLGIEMGCTMATVCTMDFQDVKRFYEKLGYICDFERQGYSQDAVCYFLKKNL